MFVKETLVVVAQLIGAEAGQVQLLQARRYSAGEETKDTESHLERDPAASQLRVCFVI